MLPCPFVDKLDSMSFATRSFEWMQLPSSILFESRDGHKLSTQCYEMIGLCQQPRRTSIFLDLKVMVLDLSINVLSGRVMALAIGSVMLALGALQLGLLSSKREQSSA